MRVGFSLRNHRQPKCYAGNGLLLESGHINLELDPLEMAVIVRSLSEIGYLNPDYLKKLKDHMTRDNITW